MPEFNYPTPDDPDFNKKVVSMLKQLFERAESQTQTFEPITTPADTVGVGTVWFDSSDSKFKVMTSGGIKTLKFE